MPFSAASLKYLGGFLVPKVASDDVTYLPNAYPTSGVSRDALNMGGRPFAIDLERREFLLGTRYGRVARLQMIDPAPHTDDNVSTFPTAPYVVPTMVDVSGHSVSEPNPPSTNKSWFEITTPYDTANTSFGGVQPVKNGKVLLSGQVYYDANNIQRRSLALANWPAQPPANAYLPQRTPFRSLGDPGSQGLVSGYFCPIPEAWQGPLKGDMLMGQASLPIISRGSAGPCAASFKTADIQTHDVMPMHLLVGYPNGHEMPEHPWDSIEADDVYAMATQITGMAIVGDYIVFVGSHGYGTPCYGYGTSDPAQADGVTYCYDPSSSAKANHAYPYRIQLWWYPLADLAQVAAGTVAPWDLRPEWFELEVPFKQLTCQVNGCAFDPTTNRLWVSVYAADGYGYEPGPVQYAWEYLPNVQPPDPPDESLEDQIEKLQKQVVALTIALGAERQRHAQTKASVQADAQVIAERTAHILETSARRRR